MTHHGAGSSSGGGRIFAAVAVAVVISAEVGCGKGGEAGPDPGFETGPCIVGECLGGLVCLSDVCVTPEPTSGNDGEATSQAPTSDATQTGASLDGTGDSTDGGGTTGTVSCPDFGIVGDDVELSFIWIANSPDGTVSKIDTRTGDEVARYATGPATQAEPSRTSVNLYGDVAVSNRGDLTGGAGGVTKIVTRIADCFDEDGSGSIETSNGPGQVLPWGADECVIWNLEIPSDVYQHGPRPTAWEGTLDDGCPSPEPRLWSGWYRFPMNTAVVHRLDGATGEILDTVEVPGLSGLDYGPYGGAVDGNGDFWAISWQLGPLIHIDGDSLVAETIPMPAPPDDQQWAYGMSLDRFGNPWVASAGAAAVYDVASGQWDFVSTGNLSMRGVAVDAQDRALFAVDANECGVAVVDVVDRALTMANVAVPGCVQPVGVSVDVDGHVWLVDQAANAAFKLDADTLEPLLVVDGLMGPYTYSDMTGTVLDLVVNGR